jgi:hypothetical protein
VDNIETFFNGLFCAKKRSLAEIISICNKK